MRFSDQQELAAYLNSLDPTYGSHAERLWQAGLRTVNQLANAEQQTLMDAGVNAFEASDMKARAGGETCSSSLVGAHIWGRCCCGCTCWIASSETHAAASLPP